MKANMSKKIHKLFVWISILMISFAYGFISHREQVFPYHLIEETRIAFHALIELHGNLSKKKVSGIDFWDDSGLKKPKTFVLSQDAGDERIFYLGNEYAHQDLCPEVGCLAWIADREGNILHIWKNTPDLWAPLEKREAVAKTWRAYPVGAYLYPNGDILVSYQGYNVFPYPMGLAKFDKDSKLVWKRNGYYSHWFSVDAEGRVYVPRARIVKSPLHVKGNMYINCGSRLFQYESVVILDPRGNEIKEIDTYKAIIESDLAGVFINYERNFYVIETCDPLHLNDVRILSEKMAHNFPRFEPGDLLLSFRSLNGVGVLDPDTGLFKWFYIGAIQYQHSPSFLDNNRILVFDNLGGSEKDNPSRVVAINVASGHAQTVFPRKDIKIPSRSFFSEEAGYIDVNADQKRMLVSWTHQGLVWEIDIESGEVLWEYLNTHPVDNSFGRLPVYTATYVYKLDFPLNIGILP
jgi:outer membrane protein assembly factor BamB